MLIQHKAKPSAVLVSRPLPYYSTTPPFHPVPLPFPPHTRQEWSFNLPVCVAQAVEILWTPSPLPPTRTHPEDHLKESLWLACGSSGIKVHLQPPPTTVPPSITNHTSVWDYVHVSAHVMNETSYSPFVTGSEEGTTLHCFTDFSIFGNFMIPYFSNHQ